MGISCWIAHKAVWSPENVATVFRDRALTYQEVEGKVASLAGYLTHALGVKEGDRVAYLGKNSDAIVALFFACARVGAIFVPLNSRMTASQLGMMIGNAEPRYVFSGARFSDTAEACTADSTAAVIHLAEDADRAISINILDLPADTPRLQCNPNRDQNIPILIAYTSGTTGVPKGAVYTQDAITFSAINSNNCWNMRGTDHVLTYLPMFHVGGLLIHSLPAFNIGAKVSIMEDFEPGAVLDRISEE